MTHVREYDRSLWGQMGTWSERLPDGGNAVEAGTGFVASESTERVIAEGQAGTSLPSTDTINLSQAAALQAASADSPDQGAFGHSTGSASTDLAQEQLARVLQRAPDAPVAPVDFPEQPVTTTTASGTVISVFTVSSQRQSQSDYEESASSGNAQPSAPGDSASTETSGEVTDPQGAGGKYLMATVTKNDGSTFAFIITSNTVISEQEDGSIVIAQGSGKAGSDTLEGTSSDDVMINLTASTVKGGAGDDTIIDLGYGTGKVIKGGSGDDTIIAQDLFGARVSGGSGDDTLQARIVADSILNMGSGDDTIEAELLSGASVRTGSGDDEFVVSMIKDTRVHMEAGDDAFWVKTVFYSQVSVGRGGDNLAFDMGTHSHFYGGSGDDNMQLGYVNTSKVSGGRGDDHIEIGSAYKARVRGGSGDDAIFAGFTRTEGSSWANKVHQVSELFQSENGEFAVGMVIGTTFSGNRGDDSIVLWNGRDSRLLGNSGNDVLLAGDSENIRLHSGRGRRHHGYNAYHRRMQDRHGGGDHEERSRFDEERRGGLGRRKQRIEEMMVPKAYGNTVQNMQQLLTFFSGGGLM